MLNKIMMVSLIVMVAIAAIMTVLQIWTSVISWDVYMKAMMTLGVFSVGCGLLLMIVSDLGKKKKMKDENYLD